MLLLYAIIFIKKKAKLPKYETTKSLCSSHRLEERLKRSFCLSFTFIWKVSSGRLWAEHVPESYGVATLFWVASKFFQPLFGI